MHISGLFARITSYNVCYTKLLRRIGNDLNRQKEGGSRQDFEQAQQSQYPVLAPGKIKELPAPATLQQPSPIEQQCDKKPIKAKLHQMNLVKCRLTENVNIREGDGGNNSKKISFKPICVHAPKVMNEMSIVCRNTNQNDYPPEFGKFHAASKKTIASESYNFV